MKQETLLISENKFAKETGSINDYQFEPNSIVIAKKNKQGFFTSAINFGTIKQTSDKHLFIEFLRYSLAFSYAENEIYNSFEAKMLSYTEIIRDESGQPIDAVQQSGFSKKVNFFNGYLNTDTFYRTNGKGYISKTYKTDSPLSKSQLKQKPKDSLFVYFGMFLNNQCSFEKVENILRHTAILISKELKYKRLVSMYVKTLQTGQVNNEEFEYFYTETLPFVRKTFDNQTESEKPIEQTKQETDNLQSVVNM